MARQAGCPPDQLRLFKRAGYVSQPTQLLFHAAARACDEPGGPTQVGFGGARGGAKSHAMIAQLAMDDCQRRAGLKCLLLRKVGKAVIESFEDMRARALSRLDHVYNQSRNTLTFPNGSRIILGHFQRESDIDAYLGLEYDVIGIEEATTLSHSKYKAIGTCNRTSRTDWRPRMYTNTNPGGIGHAWYKSLYIAPFRAGQETDTRFIPSTVDDNAFVNLEYRAKLDALTGWQLRAWRFGDWDIAAGQFFTTFHNDVHVVEVAPQPWWDYWLAMDYGWTHYTVIYLFGADYDGNVYVVDEHAERRWLVSRHAEALGAMLARNGVDAEQIDEFVAGRDVFSRDRDGRCIADEWSELGWALTAAKDERINGAAEVMRRLGDVDAGLPPSVFISPRCARLAGTLPDLEHDPHRPEDVLKVDVDEDGLGGDDPYDAFRYGLMQAGSPRRHLTVGPSPLAGYRG